MHHIPKAVIPNTITALNMLFGFTAVIYALEGRLDSAVWMVYLATFLDMLDGKIARLLRATTKFGVEFDSFSDLVTFGAAPSVLLYQAFFRDWGMAGVTLSFMPLLFSGLRLARFNIETTHIVKKQRMKGVATPISALFLVGFVSFAERYLGGHSANIEAAALLTCTIAFLMVSNISFAGNGVTRQLSSSWKLIPFFMSILTVALFGTSMLFIWACFYIVHGLSQWAFEELTERVDIRPA